MSMADISRARALVNPRKMGFEYGSSQVRIFLFDACF